MGGCISTTNSADLIELNDGGDEEFHSSYIEDVVLGEGEFGVVRKVFPMHKDGGSEAAYACKYLKKGMQWKDNTLYTALDPKILRGEVEMMRALSAGGKNNYCLEIVNVYESPKQICLIMEICDGGEMMEWVSKQTDDLVTEDVSRIAYQMLSAINHCAQHDIVHRDIKPENVMFKSSDIGSDCRLIDFGAGTNVKLPKLDSTTGKNVDYHTTFAGSAFYLSPEMFQHTYTSKTDVWSVGVTLYVLVCGFPADTLQKSFNILQTFKNRNLKALPNLNEETMPETFFDLLEQLLEYRHKLRKPAKNMLDHDFVTFHKHSEQQQQEADKEEVLPVPEQARVEGAPMSDLEIGDEVLSEDQDDADIATPMIKPRPSTRVLTKTKSVSFSGSVHRHSAFLDYRRFERSVTTLLATILTKEQYTNLVQMLQQYVTGTTTSDTNDDDDAGKQNDENKGLESSGTSKTDPVDDVSDENIKLLNTNENNNNKNILKATSLMSGQQEQDQQQQQKTENQKLHVVPIHKLKEILESIGNPDIVGMMESLKNAEMYNCFAFNVSNLRDFLCHGSPHQKRHRGTASRHQRGGRGERSSDHRMSSSAKAMRQSMRKLWSKDNRMDMSGRSSNGGMDSSIRSVRSTASGGGGGVYTHGGGGFGGSRKSFAAFALSTRGMDSSNSNSASSLRNNLKKAQSVYV